MNAKQFEIFYYKDTTLKHVKLHRHSHYEVYYFLEGTIQYQVDGQRYDLKAGDFLLLPPSIEHGAVVQSENSPYRRIVLWLEKDYFNQLANFSSNLTYGFQLALQKKQFCFREETMISQNIHWKLIELLEEIRTQRTFHDATCDLQIAAFITYLNRIISEAHQVISYEKPLYLRICDYVNTHLAETLSLQQLADVFFMSKFHLSHKFKAEMGLGIHQYITKKRLEEIKRGIPSGIPLAELAINYGFSDYSSFFRAFKNEYQLSPKEYRQQVQLITNYEEHKNYE